MHFIPTTSVSFDGIGKQGRYFATSSISKSKQNSDISPTFTGDIPPGHTLTSIVTNFMVCSQCKRVWVEFWVYSQVMLYDHFVVQLFLSLKYMFLLKTKKVYRLIS